MNNKGQENKRSNIAPVNINANPVFVINGGNQYTPTRSVQLTILAATAQQMMLSNKANFSGAQWETFRTSKQWQLESGEGQKTVYLKVKYKNGQESQPVFDTIEPQPVTNTSIQIAQTDTTNTLMLPYIYMPNTQP